MLNYYDINNLSSKETVAILCYSGQSASYGASLLRMLGYTNVKAMKWGMSSWNPARSGKWTSNLLNAYATQMVTEDVTKNSTGDFPNLTTASYKV